MSEGITNTITDDTATDDDTVDHTQGSDDEAEPETSEAEQEQVSESLAIPSGPKRMDCPEDDDFLSALDKMVSENIQERMREPVKAGNVDISVPVVLKSNKKTYEQLQVCLLFCVIFCQNTNNNVRTIQNICWVIMCALIFIQMEVFIH